MNGAAAAADAALRGAHSLSISASAGGPVGAGSASPEGGGGRPPKSHRVRKPKGRLSEEQKREVLDFAAKRRCSQHEIQEFIHSIAHWRPSQPYVSKLMVALRGSLDREPSRTDGAAVESTVGGDPSAMAMGANRPQVFLWLYRQLATLTSTEKVALLEEILMRSDDAVCAAEDILDLRRP